MGRRGGARLSDTLPRGFPSEPLPRRLARQRVASLAALWFERAWPAAWPAVGVWGAFACLALFGLVDRLSPLAHAGVLAVTVSVSAALLWRARAALARPAASAADRRLEHLSGVTHQPLSVLADRPAGATDEAALAFWRGHQAWARAQLSRLRVGWPRSALAARDPRALRLLLLLGVTSGMVVAGPDAGARLWRAVWPALPRAAPVPALEISAWVTPPPWTFLPPSLLPEQPGADETIAVPAGSRLALSLSGGRGGTPAATVDGVQIPFETVGAGSFQLALAPRSDGVLAVRRDGTVVAQWRLAMRPDPLPEISWAKPPSVQRGRLPLVRLSWRARHEYGLAEVAARLRLRDRPQAPELVLPLTLPGEHPREAAGQQTHDVTAHPWAGLPVRVTLAARDAAGQWNTATPVDFTLPLRHFRHPGAQAIVPVRQALALDPAAGGAAARMLRDLADRADLWRGDRSAADTLRGLAHDIDGTPAPETVGRVQDALWQLALRMEETTPARTNAALREAEKRLHEAIDQARKKAPDAAGRPRRSQDDHAAIDQRAQALQDALHRHLDALAEQARRDPSSVTPVPQAEQDALDRALQALRDSAREDRMDDASRQMQALEQQLDEMRRESRSEAEKKRAEGRQRGRQQMTALSDLTRREATLIDRAEQRLADTNAGEPPPADPDAVRGQDRRMQGALRRVLGELMQLQGDLTGTVPKNFGDADAAMRDVLQALAEARDDAASAAALRAVQALQEGGRDMSQQLARKFGRPKATPDGSPEQGDGEQADAGDGDQDPQSGSAGQLGQGGQGEQGQDEFGQGQNQGDGQGDGQGEAALEPGDGSGPDGRRVPGQRDPFGRAQRDGIMGTTDGSETRVPGRMERARSGAIQDELRRREAERSRPQTELDYIGRLLREHR